MSRNRKIAMRLHYELGFYGFMRNVLSWVNLRKRCVDKVLTQWLDMAFLTENIVVYRF